MLGHFQVPSFGMEKHPWWAPTKLRVYRIDLEKICRDIIRYYVSRLIVNTFLNIIRRCFLWETQIREVQKLRVLKRIVFLPVGGGVGHLKNNHSRENILQLYGMCVLSFMFLKLLVSCQELAEALQQNSTLTHLNLRSDDIGDEKVKAWCLVRIGSWVESVWRTCKGRVKAPQYESDIRAMSERRCSAVLMPKCATFLIRISVIGICMNLFFWIRRDASGWNLWWQHMTTEWVTGEILAGKKHASTTLPH